MTRIRELLLGIRTRRSRRLAHSDSVSFDAFCNEGPSDQFPITKESTLSDIKLSPERTGGREYVQFSAQNAQLNECTRPSCVTMILIIMLVAVFLVLPTIYLMHCFGVIHISHENFSTHAFALKEQDHYAPSQKIHDALSPNHVSTNQISPTMKGLPPPPKPDYKQCMVLKDEQKFDCYPEDGADRDKCEARGCCWVQLKMPRGRKLKRVNSVPLDVPYCFYPSNFESYKFINISETDFGLLAFMNRTYHSAYPDDIETLKVIVKYESENRLHVKILDAVYSRYEPPVPEVAVIDKAAENYSFIFDYTTTGFKVLRKSDNSIIFDAMQLQSMIFADQFIQISALLPSSNIFGIGEHRSHLKLSTKWSRFTLFNHDAVPSENRNLYGSHPFYLNIEKSGNSNGVFLFNSNAMDIILQPTPAITYRTIGGILNFYFMLGPTPADVIRQYTELIGRSFMPPYWGLGFHLCRFGYKTLNETRKVMQRTIDAGIPLDTQWNDLDYMNNSNDFTYDHQNFKGLPKFVQELHKKGMHYIPLIDPGVSASEIRGQYPPYDKGIEMDIFVKNSTGQPFIGKVWNRASTVWPDFTHPKSVNYWTDMLRSLHDAIMFDGAWIDMNEPSNFLSGSFDGCPKSSLENPPYLPAIDGGVINYKTLCMSAQHYAGLHYNVHNLYGIVEAIVTNFALAEIRGLRPMIISRSTFPGLGKFAGHWGGDVYSEWKDMKFSIPQLLSFSLFGIPLMGSDICGFNGNTTAPLCNRWMQLGAFYPFSRNHNTDDGIDQDPVALGPNVVASSKVALSIRYSLLPYLYTLFWKSHVDGDTVARPLFFEYINDPKTYSIDDQFLWGSGLMIVPVLEDNREWVNPYIPAGIWYDYYTLTAIKSQGEMLNMSAPLDKIPLLIRGGSVIPQQEPKPTTAAARKTKMQLLAASNETYQGFGELYWDDGDSLNSVEERKYSYIRFVLNAGSLKSDVVLWGPENPPNLGLVRILGVNPISEVIVNDISPLFKYDTIHKYLLIDNLDISLKHPLVITWK